MNTFKKGLFLLVALLISSQLLAQEGRIVGTVVDAETGETLIGVNVVIEGTIQGTATDIDGNYTIRRVAAGTYNIKVSYLSYSTQLITGVVVGEGEVVRLDIAMQAESEFLDEIVVTAEAVQSGEAGLLAAQKKSVPVQDGISSEQISRTGDGNVGSAMKRVSGVSVVGGKDVYVRGLGNRYSNVQLNGAPVPSTNPNKKEAPVDILSSGIVDNILVQKTFTSDQFGEFSGGSVKIITKEFPDSKNLSISYSTEINSVSTFNEYLGYSGGGTDYLGFDDGFRSLPEDVKDSDITSDTEAASIVNDLNSSWTPKNITSLPSQKISVSYSNQLNEDKMPIGVVSNVSYKYATDLRLNEVLRYIDNYNEDRNIIALGSDYIRNTGMESTSLSTMLNVFVKPSSVTKIGIKNLYSNSSNNTFSEIEGTYYNFDGENRQTIQEFDRRAIFSSSLNFETYFRNFQESKLEANFTYSKAVRDLPDRRTTQYARTDNNDLEIVFPFRGNGHFFSFQNDNNYSGGIDYELKPFDKLDIKVGAFGLYKNRSFESYKLVYEIVGTNFPEEDKLLSPEDIFTGANINAGYLDLTERSSSRDSYDGEQELAAGYFSFNWSPSDRWNIVTGLRAENSAQFIDGDVLIDELDILPALNLTFRPTDETNLRGAFSITLARPEFRELSNFNFQDFIGGRTVYGNPDLERTRIFNYDLRWETYPNTGELFALSAFYKKFENPIELFYRRTQNNEVKYDNIDEANLYGIELEGRKSITERLRLSSNLSLIYSEVVYSDGASTGRQANAERAMFGQSPYTFNANAFYIFPKLDAEAAISFNTFGKRISAVGKNEQPDDEFEQPFNKLDVSFTKYFGKASVSASIENILNDNITYKQGDVITNQYEIGTTFSVSFNFSFN